MNVPAKRASGVWQAVGHSFSAMFQLVFRSNCALCGARSSPASALCSDCASQFALLGPARCAKCGRPLGDPSVTEHSDAFVCGECRAEKRYFDRALATFVYGGAMREAILAFKYRRRFTVGHALGRLWSRYLPAQLQAHWDSDNEGRPDMIVPVPLHISRLREREFNQSAILAKSIGKSLGISVRYEALERVKATEFQSGLSPRQRGLNVKGAFEVRSPAAVYEARIVLIDDIITTGATLNECAKVLKKAGAASVVAAALATPSQIQLGEELGDDTGAV